jgi:outer membrane protein OmpA-like peptidoglycan-associated protein
MMKLQVKYLRSKEGSISIGTKLSAHTLVFSLLTSVAQANVVGSDTQNFNPTTSGLGFVTTESSETLNVGLINTGLFFDYAVNTLPYIEDDAGSRSEFDNKLAGAVLHVGAGVAKNLDLGLSLPYVLTQSVGDEKARGQFAKNGNTDVRANAKYRLWNEGERGVAIQAVADFNRIKNNPYTGTSAGPIYSLVVAGDQTVGDFKFGLNIGYRFRQAGSKNEETKPLEPLTSQIIASGAVAYKIAGTQTSVISEIFASQPTNKYDTNAHRVGSSAELLIGFKNMLREDTALHGGFGTELIHGLSSPDWRIYLGVNYTIGIATEEKPKAPEPEKTETTNAFPTEPKAFENVVVHDILFKFNSDHLIVSSSRKALEDLAAHLRKPPGFIKLEIVGHADGVGSHKYNDSLSQRRAQSIKKWLVDKGHIDAKRIIVEGRGKREPVADNRSGNGRQLNRRVEFKIYRDMANLTAQKL